jgi:hypothetical protein
VLSVPGHHYRVERLGVGGEHVEHGRGADVALVIALGGFGPPRRLDADDLGALGGGRFRGAGDDGGDGRRGVAVDDE